MMFNLYIMDSGGLHFFFLVKKKANQVVKVILHGPGFLTIINSANGKGFVSKLLDLQGVVSD